MVKAADLGTLSQDTSSISERLTDFLVPHVTYDDEIEATTFLAYGDNASLATALSGTTDKKSKPYKAAIRNVQMWKKGQSTPGKRYQQKMVSALAAKGELPHSTLVDAAGNVKQGASISITGYIRISDTPAEYRTLHAHLSTDSLQDFTDNALSGESQQALEVFADSGNYPSFGLYGSESSPIVVTFSE